VATPAPTVAANSPAAPADAATPDRLAQAAAQTLPRLPRELPPTHFDSLRRTALQAAQHLAGDHWTDYNLHDPGVTLLEAFAYAATELAYRADAPVATLLADAQGAVDWARHGLHPPPAALPCRPSTAADLQRWLLDRVQAADGSAGLAGLSLRPGAWPGVLDAVLEPAAGADAATLAAAVRREAARVRTMGQDLGVLHLLRRRPCRLLGELRIEGPRAPALIVAEVHQRCADWLAAGPALAERAALLQQGQPTEEVWEGPPTHLAHEGPTPTPVSAADTVVMADLVRCARAVEGVADVAWLALQPEGEAPQHAAVPLRSLQAPGDGAATPRAGTVHDAGWRLVLAEPAADGDLGLRLVRRGNAMDLDPHAVRRQWLELQELRAVRAAQRPTAAAPAGAKVRDGFDDDDDDDGARADAARTPAAPAPEPPPRHVPLQQHLPAAYAVGRSSLGSDATPTDRRRAQQLQGYVALLDQWLAHAAAQQAHWRTLFDAAPEPAPSVPPTYAWHTLGPAELPDLAPLLDTPPAQIEARHARPADAAVARRSRLLDLLLALQGQAWPQHSLRPFLDDLPPPAREARLLALKQALARDICRFNRDRAAGFDPARPAWGRHGNQPGLQRRCALLLGSLPGPWRALTAGLQGRELVEADDGHLDDTAAAGPAAGPDDGHALLPLDLGCPAAQRAAAGAAARLRQLALARQRRLPGALLRCAARHDRWSVRASADGWTLVLGPDEHGRHWAPAVPKADAVAAAAAATPAAGTDDAAWLAALAHAVALHRFAQALDTGSEGLHVVEHLLLRPLGGAPAHDGVPASFHAHRCTVVLPAWTQRGRRTAWRDLAEETLRLNAPAHLHLQVLWLAPAEMTAFEERLQAWLLARAALGDGSDAAHLRQADAQAAALTQWLQARQAELPAAHADDRDDDDLPASPDTDTDADAEAHGAQV
jgi:hypothetical protein